MTTLRMIDPDVGEIIRFSFVKGTPGDIYRYKNCLELPSVFGAEIHVFPERWGVSVFVENMDLNEAIYYVGQHKRDRKKDVLKF